MKFSLSLSLLMGLVGTAASATAVPITYNITFMGGSPTPTAGSFTYDATLDVFTDFTVTWDGIVFNLTGGANSPNQVGNGCNPIGTSGRQDLFAVLNGTLCSPYWEAGNNSPGPGGAGFSIYGGVLQQGGGGLDFTDVTVSTIGTGRGTGGFGTWVTEASTATPEPSTLALMLAGGALLALRRRNRSTQLRGTSQP